MRETTKGAHATRPPRGAFHRRRRPLDTDVGASPQASPRKSPRKRGGVKPLGALLGDGHLIAGDPVVVSAENGHFALAIGFVREVGPTWITVGLDRALLGPPLPLAVDPAPGQALPAARQQPFAGLWERVPPAAAAAAAPAAAPADVGDVSVTAVRTDRPERLLHTRFRIDKDELAAGMGTIRNNIIGLFTASGDKRLRELIVDLACTCCPAGGWRHRRETLTGRWRTMLCLAPGSASLSATAKPAGGPHRLGGPERRPAAGRAHGA